MNVNELFGSGEIDMESENKLSVQRQHRFDASDIPDMEIAVQRCRIGKDDDGNEFQTSDWDQDSPEYKADLFDFSSRGLKLSVPFSAQFEEVLGAKLTFKSLKYTFYCRANVRHIREEEGRWVIGCSIDPHIPDVLIDYLAEVSGKERRLHPRIKTNTKARIVRAGETTEWLEGTLINLSKGGFCFHSENLVEVDERVKLEFYNEEDHLETISIRVCWHSKAEEGGYHIGCSFAGADAYEKLCNNVEVQPPEIVIQRADKHTWYVIAMSVAALLLPPIFTFGLEYWSDEPTVAEVENVESTPIELDKQDTKSSVTTDIVETTQNPLQASPVEPTPATKTPIDQKSPEKIASNQKDGGETLNNRLGPDKGLNEANSKGTALGPQGWGPRKGGNDLENKKHVQNLQNQADLPGTSSGEFNQTAASKVSTRPTSRRGHEAFPGIFGASVDHPGIPKQTVVQTSSRRSHTNPATVNSKDTPGKSGFENNKSESRSNDTQSAESNSILSRLLDRESK